MKKIIEYKAVVQSNLLKLNLLINEAIQDGWQPYGGVAVAVIPPSDYIEMAVTCTQVLVKWEYLKNEKS